MNALTSKDESVSPPIVTVDLLHQALTSQQLSVEYQPQVCTASGELKGYEALLRWHSPSHGHVPPAILIAATERIGMSQALGEYVLDRALNDLPALTRTSEQAIHVSVNVSGQQINAAGYAEGLLVALEYSEILPAQLRIELAEAAILAGNANLVRNVQVLAEAGVAIWLDNYGSGTMAVRALRDLPLSGIKLDHSLIRDLHRNAPNLRLVRGTIAMAHCLDLSVLAEGVEASGELQVLRQMGCETVQGFLFGPATTLDGAVARWRSQNPLH
jgi:EAL domain-containing protein (putative c-di-GMP-specific phosphodiesterase class I)